MLVIRRGEGQWVEVTHAASGDVLRFRVYDIQGPAPGKLHLAFDDEARDFAIRRPDRSPCPLGTGDDPRPRWVQKGTDRCSP